MLYAPFVVSTHNVPDQAVHDNMSTALTQRERWLSQLYVFNRAALTANSRLIRRFGRLQRGYTKKKMAMSFAREGQHSEALAYALDGLASGFNLKWLAMTMLIGMLLMALGFWAYTFVAALLRLRCIVLERERHTDWAKEYLEKTA